MQESMEINFLIFSLTVLHIVQNGHICADEVLFHGDAPYDYISVLEAQRQMGVIVKFLVLVSVIFSPLCIQCIT